jgi:uncharacterized membrane protein YkvA (DUF1232 family)
VPFSESRLWPTEAVLKFGKAGSPGYRNLEDCRRGICHIPGQNRSIFANLHIKPTAPVFLECAGCGKPTTEKAMFRKIRKWAEALKHQLVIVHLASQDPRTPWYAKALLLLILAYALSPIDLIPDFIPVLGLLDDLILLPVAVYAVLKLIPEHVLHDASLRAATYSWKKERNWFGLLLIVVLWLVAFWVLYQLLAPQFSWKKLEIAPFFP